MKQAVYFGIPMLFILFMTSAISRNSPSWPMRMASQAMASEKWELSTAGRVIAAIDRQSELELKMQQLRSMAPAKHFTYHAELQYFKAIVLAEQFRWHGTSISTEREESLAALRIAIAQMEESLEHPAPFYHRENMALTREQMQQRISAWRRELAEVQLGQQLRPQSSDDQISSAVPLR